MTQLSLVHEFERAATQDHLDDNRNRFGRQCQQVYDALIKYGDHGITCMTEEVRHIMRLPSRINDLKNAGLDIDATQWMKVGQTKIKIYKVR